MPAIQDLEAFLSPSPGSGTLIPKSFPSAETPRACRLAATHCGSVQLVVTAELKGVNASTSSARRAPGKAIGSGVCLDLPGSNRRIVGVDMEGEWRRL